MSHTKEPWSINVCTDGEILICGATGHQILQDDDKNAIADARRIVACVNACEGIITETLEHTPKAIGSYIRQCAEHQISIDTYRDLCVGLLEELRETHAGLCFTKDYIGTLRYDRNKAAITKAEEIMGEKS